MIASTIRSISRSLTCTLKYNFAPPKQKPGAAPPAPAPAAKEAQPQIIQQQQPITILSADEVAQMQAIGERIHPDQKLRLERLSKVIHGLQLPTFLHFIVRNYDRDELKLVGKTQLQPADIKSAWQSLQREKQVKPQVKKETKAPKQAQGAKKK